MNLKALRISAAVDFRRLRKILYVMKLTCILLFVSVMTVSASTFAQKITLNEKNASLETVLKKIRLQSGYDLVCAEELLDKASPVTVKLKDASLEETLEAVFAHQELSYKVEDKLVIVKAKEPSFIEQIKAMITAIDIHGTVADEKGLAIPGATVKLKDNSQATITDAKGNFTLKHVDAGAVLLISFIGYETLEIGANQPLDHIQLKLSKSELDEVKVIAYGQTTQRFDLGNVASVKAKDIEKQNVTNPLLALQGRVPGLLITPTNGYTNGNVTVRIQGTNSINNGNEPFYVIDGVPYPSTLKVLYGAISGGASPLAFINPQDIESISVLKDADATSIYGSQAANGAIVITTKKGGYGPIKVDVSVNQGTNLPAGKLPLLKLNQYLEMRQEAVKNGGQAIGPQDYDLNGLWNRTGEVDWQKELLGNGNTYTNATIGLSGGTAAAHYNISGTYNKNTLPVAKSFNDQRGALHFNVGSVSANHKFKIDLTGNYLYDNNQLPNFEVTWIASVLAPNVPALRNPDGSINWVLDANGTSSLQVYYRNNPYAGLLTHYNVTSRNTLGNLQMSYELMTGLTASLNSGYTYLTNDELETTPLSSFSPADQLYATNGARWGITQNTGWNIDPTLQYNGAWKKHDLTALAGGTFRKASSYNFSYSAAGFPTDMNMTDITQAQTSSFGQPSNVLYQYTALFGRLNYRYNERWLFDADIRRDGSSRFGENNKFHVYYSFAGGWIFTESDFFKNQLPFLSFGKLRVSYGLAGSDQIGDYSYLTLYGVINPNIPYVGIKGLQPSGLSNPYLQWEETRKWNFGVDLGWLKDRIVLNLSYYRNRSSNEILSQALPSITGYGSIATNFGATVQNSGLEVVLNTRNIQKDKFKWSTTLNFGENRNKLVSFNGIDQTPYASNYILGRTLSLVRLFDYAGVNPTTGYYQFRKKDGTLTSTPSDDDAYILQDLTPSFMGGIGNTFTYHKVSLDFFFQFVRKYGNNYRRGISGVPPGLFPDNQPVTVMDRWQKPGDVKDVQQFSTNFDAYNTYSIMQRSTGGIADASYIRLKTVQLSWNILSNKTFKNLQLVAQAQNLLTFTHYLGDPATGTYDQLPNLKTFTIGLKSTL